METVSELEKIEKDVCNLPLIFAEIFKDEINANSETKMYNGVKRVIKKYSEDKNAMAAVNEFVRVLSGGASLNEILLIAKDEAISPTASTEISVGGSCRLDNETPNFSQVNYP